MEARARSAIISSSSLREEQGSEIFAPSRADASTAERPTGARGQVYFRFGTSYIGPARAR